MSRHIVLEFVSRKGSHSDDAQNKAPALGAGALQFNLPTYNRKSPLAHPARIVNNLCSISVDRADKLGVRYREQFIFPLRVNRALYNPTRPASKSWLRHQTRVLRERTGINHLNPDTWRHQLCTEMLEQGVPAENVIGVLGRVSENMLEAYKHTRLQAKQEALGIARANVIAFPGQRSPQR
ncbi:MAG: hypothetical protein QOH35_5497 [Acidobacteriaceae bacterium]|nr:hypothetical protein [Acidobacteriaceae bacterium]